MKKISQSMTVFRAGRRWSAVALAAAALFIGASHLPAQISVTSGGAGPLTFDTTPAVTEFSTGVLNGNATTFQNTAALDAAVDGLSASSIVRPLPTSGTVPPSTFSGGFRHNTGAGLYLQSRPTTDGTNAASVLLATLVNNSGADIAGIELSYTFGINNAVATELPGFRVYYSLSGAPGTWSNIAALSDIETAGTQSAIQPLGSWPNGSTMYLLWADDNADGATDPSYTIDNLIITVSGGTAPLSVSLTAPATSTLIAPANVTVTAFSAGTVPATSVSFYTNDVLFFTDTTAPYSNQLVNLAPGTYSIYAVAVNGIETAYSATNIVTVRPQFVPYTGGTISENFDASMGPSGTSTPNGWYVGAALPANGVSVTVGDGSAGASGAVLGWNYGLTGDADRALGVAATGGDRNIEVQDPEQHGEQHHLVHHYFRR